MNQDHETFKYRAIAEVKKGEILYTLSSNEFFNNEIQLVENENEGYKIFAGFKDVSGLASLNKLILERKFVHEQNCDVFRSNAQEIINSYFNKLKFLHYEYFAEIGSPDLIIKPDGSSIIYSVMGLGMGMSTQIPRLSLQKDSKLLNMPIGFLDECIERYNVIMEFKDPVLRLISLYGLVELIQDKFRDKPDTLIRNNFKVDDLVRSTRNLVAHVVVDHPNTTRHLGLRLGQADKFRFSRKNGKQMELVNDCVTKLAGELYQYLINQLSEGV